MSTIVVTRKHNHVCIAADSLTTFGETRLSAEYDKYHNKIQLLGDSYVGIVGSAAHSIVIEDIYEKGYIEFNLSSRKAIFNTFLKLHAILKEHYFLNTKGEEDDPYETSHIDAVIANRHGIFSVYGLRDVNEFERFWAVGSGSDHALGAMYAVYDLLDSAEAIAYKGVEAGATFNNSTALPINCEVITLAAA